MAKANVCCSIEMEPKTLNQGQLYQAREVAADVVQNLEPSEASVVFIDMAEQFKYVNPTIERGGHQLPPQPQPQPQDYMGECCKEIAQDYNERRCQCSYLPTESPNQLQQLLKEPLSAPF